VDWAILKTSQSLLGSKSLGYVEIGQQSFKAKDYMRAIALEIKNVGNIKYNASNIMGGKGFGPASMEKRRIAL